MMATSALAKAATPAKTAMTGPDIGIDAPDRRKIAEHLVQILADTYTLLVKTHVYHWNVVGPVFLPFHELTEKHYKDLFEAADVIAERIRSLGHPAPLSFEAMLPKAVVDEETSNRTADGMIIHLVQDHEAMVKRLRTSAGASEDADDLVTTDLITKRLEFHEKAIWMLRAMGHK
jgi:starvation-inducible DNA-binding protein